MTTEKARRQRHRRMALVGLGVSVALHAAIFATLSFEVPEQTDTPAGTVAERAVAAPVPAMEVVRIVEVPQVDPEVVTSDRPVVTAPSPIDRPQPPSSSLRTPATAPSATVSAAAAPALSTIELIAASSLNGSLTTRVSFGSPGQVPGALDAIAAADPHAGHDHGEEDEEEGRGFWQRLGDAWGKVAMGSGGGKVCRPPILGPGGTLDPSPAPLPIPKPPVVIRKQ